MVPTSSSVARSQRTGYALRRRSGRRRPRFPALLGGRRASRFWRAGMPLGLAAVRLQLHLGVSPQKVARHLLCVDAQAKWSVSLTTFLARSKRVSRCGRRRSSRHAVGGGEPLLADDMLGVVHRGVRGQKSAVPVRRPWKRSIVRRPEKKPMKTQRLRDQNENTEARRQKPEVEDFWLSTSGFLILFPGCQSLLQP